ncbi:MAG: PilZ domain-containing protein [Acidiferrobacterales bacterium]|nr:PilZ domain-containing protein [Acidiferrobacterales bacterium]
MNKTETTKPAVTEHRWSRRQPLAIDITVYDDRGRLFIGRSHNVSIGGMFIDTPGVRLPVNADLTVAFVKNTGNDVVRLRVPILVIHSIEGGAGFMFRRFNAETVHALRSIVQSPVGQTLL